ncbi:NAD(P)H-dependent oxidoreductase [Bifidobacterium callimiconis]|uniref:NAD(P)H-dependent oxidoreductase n=1 Tax=Bifidobacterium callimiconis TaxID=2306973 RepID=UPI001C2F13F4|nr:NAD(P)H-dependent oxidoreductase [Bifidobacterium callimiconis]
MAESTANAATATSVNPSLTAPVKTLVLVFHPDLEGASRVNKALAAAARTVGNVTVVDEYATYPAAGSHPGAAAIDVAAEQAALLEADRIVWQFPMYWYSSPALLKQWEDDVLALGWAYGPGGGKLAGKEFRCAVSCGSTADEYTPEGKFRATIDEVLNPMRITAEYVEGRWGEPFAVYGCTPEQTDAQIDEAAARYAQWLAE